MEQTEKEELNKKIEFLQMHIDERISRFTSKRIDNKFKARNFYVSTTVLAAISTIVLGLDVAGGGANTIIEGYDKLTKNIALIISAIITIVSAYDSFFDHKSLWVNFTTAKSKMRSLKFDLDYYLEGNDNIAKEDIERFKARYIDILNDVGKKWSNLRNE
jgi:hypothetical protein